MRIRATSVERYENALRALPKELPAGIPDMLRRQLAEQVANVALQAAVEKVA